MRSQFATHEHFHCTYELQRYWLSYSYKKNCTPSPLTSSETRGKFATILNRSRDVLGRYVSYQEGATHQHYVGLSWIVWYWAWHWNRKRKYLNILVNSTNWIHLDHLRFERTIMRYNQDISPLPKHDSTSHQYCLRNLKAYRVNMIELFNRFTLEWMLERIDKYHYPSKLAPNGTSLASLTNNATFHPIPSYVLNQKRGRNLYSYQKLACIVQKEWGNFQLSGLMKWQGSNLSHDRK